MSRRSRALRIALLTVVLALPLALAAPSRANTFACCLPDGSCQNEILMTCDQLGGVSLIGRSCMDATCRPEAPVLSPLGLAALLFAVSAVAIHGLHKRRTS